jgi:hypothetical protein
LLCGHSWADGKSIFVTKRRKKTDSSSNSSSTVNSSSISSSAAELCVLLAAAALADTSEQAVDTLKHLLHAASYRNIATAKRRQLWSLALEAACTTAEARAAAAANSSSSSSEPWRSDSLLARAVLQRAIQEEVDRSAHAAAVQQQQQQRTVTFEQYIIDAVIPQHAGTGAEGKCIALVQYVFAKRCTESASLLSSELRFS